MREKILITGASGYVGSALTENIGPSRALPLYGSRPLSNGRRFDARTMKLGDVISEAEAGSISHCVILHAVIDIETCAAEPERAREVNVLSAIDAIDWCLEHGVKPVFISSEAVFYRDQGPPPTERDAPNPYAAYGRMKLEVESYLQQAAEDHVIIRLSRVMGPDRNDRTGFEAWFRAFDENTPIPCPVDQVITPVRVTDAARGIALAIENNLSGLYHLAGPEEISRYDLLKLLIRERSATHPQPVEIVRCRLSDFPVRDKRPLKSTLDPEKFLRETGMVLPTYQQWCRELL